MRYDDLPKFDPIEYRDIETEPPPELPPAPLPVGPMLAVVRRVLIALAIPVAWLLLALMLWYTAPRAGPFPKIGFVIHAHYPSLVHPLKTALLFCWFAALALVIIAELSRKRGGIVSRRIAGFSAATVLLLPAPLMWVDMGGIWPMWQDQAELRLTDGVTYHLQSGGVLQGRTVAITQEVSRGRLFLRTRVLALASGESYSILVRPRGAATYKLASTGEGTPWLRLVSSADDRWLAAIRSTHFGGRRACGAAVVYDRKSNKPYGFAELRGLSPFILIGPHDELSEEDVAALLGMTDSNSYELGPIRDALSRESSNPNPRVRKLVQMLRTRPAGTDHSAATGDARCQSDASSAGQ